jgi:hypothetical protein
MNTSLRLLYPSDCFQPKRPDEVYAEEHDAAIAAGIAVSLFSYEDFQAGELKFRTKPLAGESVIYRGWMLSETDYRRLNDAIEALGANMLTCPESYIVCHHLPRWLPLLSEFTAETRIFSEHDDIAGALLADGWEECFLKDYVKSLATDGGSVVRDLSQIPTVIDKMKKYRGQIEGGIWARRLESYDTASEKRYFVYLGVLFGDGVEVPELVRIAAERIKSPFFTVDTAMRSDGVLRIIELGDGQVSDRKHWSSEDFIRILSGPVNHS